MQKSEINKNKKQMRKNDLDLEPCLLLVNGISAGKMVHVHKNSMSIGSAENNDIILDANGIDQEHAFLDIVDKNNITISNRSKDQLIRVNGQSVHQASLSKDDHIQIGDQKIKFVYRSFDELASNALNFEKNMLTASGLALKKEFFENQLQLELEHSEMRNLALSCAMLSIDSSTSNVDVNQQIELIKKSSRAYDVLGLYQGNIFCVLLKNTALDNALVFAKRLHHNFTEVFQDSVQVNMGICSSDNERVQGASSMLHTALIYLQEARKRPDDTFVSPRNI